jgi:hypothetical protein
MISAEALTEKDGYIGYEELYAASHQSLDEDDAFQQDVRSVALTLARATRLQDAQKLVQPDLGLRPRESETSPRPLPSIPALTCERCRVA